MIKLYPSDLSDFEWDVVKEMIDSGTVTKPRTIDMRQVFNGIRYLLKTGCQWRMLPREYPPWQTVYYYFDKWKRDDTIKNIHDKLVKVVRVQAGKKTISFSRHTR